MIDTVWLIVGGIGAAIVALLGAYAQGRISASAKAKQKRADDYKKTRKDLDDAPDFDSPADARDWLREHGQ